MKNSAVLSIAGAGTLWGLIGLFVNLLATKGFDPLQITTLRVTTALLLTALIIWRTDIRQFFICPKDWWMFFGNGVIGLVFFNWCYFNAIAGGSLAIAALLLYTACRQSVRQPGNLSVRFGQRFRLCAVQHFRQARHQAIFRPHGQPLVFSLCRRLYPSPFRPGRQSGFVQRQDGLGRYPWHRADQLCISQHIMISCVFPNILYMRGLQQLEAGHAAILATIEPVVAAIVSYLFLGEAFTWQKVLGIVLILSAVPILNRNAGKS